MEDRLADSPPWRDTIRGGESALFIWHSGSSLYEGVRISSPQSVIVRPRFLKSWQSHLMPQRHPETSPFEAARISSFICLLF